MTWNDLDTCICRSPKRCFGQIVSDKALQVLRESQEWSIWSRISSASLESIAAAGRVGFWWRVADPSSSLATSSGWRLAEAATISFSSHHEKGTPKASTPSWRRQVSDTFDFDAWNCSRWQRGTGGTKATQNCSRSRLGFRCDGANGRFELFAHWSLGSSLLSLLQSDPSIGLAKTSWCQVAELEEGRFH